CYDNWSGEGPSGKLRLWPRASTSHLQDILKSLMERVTTMCVMHFHKNYPVFREYLKKDQVDEKLTKLGKILVARLNERLNMLEKQGK
ncbi:hypothetical protein T265_13306, partial [Opisthorchis viverrini]